MFLLPSFFFFLESAPDGDKDGTFPQLIQKSARRKNSGKTMVFWFRKFGGTKQNLINSSLNAFKVFMETETGVLTIRMIGD